MTTTITVPQADLDGKYLTFIPGGEACGIPVLKVRKIISGLQISQEPQVPDYLNGVINIRAKFFPRASPHGLAWARRS